MPDRATYLANTYSVLVTSVTEAVDNAAFVVVAVKPGDVESVLGELARAAAGAEKDSPEQVYVTVAAGITINHVESKLPAGTPVIRAMRTRRRWWARASPHWPRAFRHRSTAR